LEQSGQSPLLKITSLCLPLCSTTHDLTHAPRRLPNRTHHDVKPFAQPPPPPYTRALAIDLLLHTLHVHMPAIVLQLPRRPVLLAVRTASAAARELFAGWTVDCQAEEVARLAEIRVPVSVSQEVDQSY
jgi:hypothetical protein